MDSLVIGRLSGNKVMVAKPRPDIEVRNDDPALQRIKNIDRNVRLHENSHASADGVQTIGTARYKYAEGPDGKLYAVGGEVTVAVQSSGKPEDNLRAARALRSSALSSDNPSPADFAAAADAGQIEIEALSQMAKRAKEIRETIHRNDSSPAQKYSVSENLSESVSKNSLINYYA